MTFGTYFMTDSPVHGLDPRTKLAGSFLYVISLFFPMREWGLLIPAAFLCWIVFLSKAPLASVFRGLKPLWGILLFTAVLNLCMTGGHVLWEAGPVSISREGIHRTVFLLIRLVLLVGGTSILTLTTTAKEVADGLEKSLGFLNKVGIPVHEFAMMMGIAMRFIPILSDEFERIRNAQMSRGADFEEGNLIVRAKKTLPVLIPLFVSALRRADRLALAMDARCYHGGEGRSKLHPLVYKRRDFAAYGILFAYVFTMALLTFGPGWVRS